MNTTPIEDFIPYIAPQAQDCPDFVIRQTLVSTVVDMCQRTGCLRTETVVPVKKDEKEIEIRLAYQLKPEVIRHVFMNGSELTDIRRDELSHYYAHTDWADYVGEPRFYTFEKPGILQLFPTPSKDCELRLELSASVGRSAAQIPEVFFEDYLDTVVVGTLSRIFRIAGQGYTNIRLADEYELKYSAGCAEIRREVSRGFTKRTGHVFYNRII